MPKIYDLYSRRRTRELRQEPDVYEYDSVPEILRGQIVHIWADAIGGYSRDDYRSRRHNNKAWEGLHAIICREKGVESLCKRNIPRDDLVAYLQQEQNVDKWLDVVELTFRYVDRGVSEMSAEIREDFGISVSAKSAIDELNERFQHASFGYRFDNGYIVRIDSEFVHAEIVKPSLALLSDRRFSTPQKEYLTAHGHYRAGDFSDAVTNASNAFESTMKVICDIKILEYNKGDRASDLIKIMRKNGLLPEYTEKAFDAFLSTLQHGLPTVRNNDGGHGKGNAPATPQHIAAYAMHLAAANIVLLVEAFQASEKTS